MGRYVSFEQATHDALVYTCRHLNFELNEATCATLCDVYLNLSPYPEVPATLQQLNNVGLPLAILSNGSAFSIDSVVKNSGLQTHFANLLSVEPVEVRSEEHTSELQSLMRISYAVFCLKKKHKN